MLCSRGHVTTGVVLHGSHEVCIWLLRQASVKVDPFPVVAGGSSKPSESPLGMAMPTVPLYLLICSGPSA